jgi:hypothetical protein
MSAEDFAYQQARAAFLAGDDAGVCLWMMLAKDARDSGDEAES